VPIKNSLHCEFVQPDEFVYCYMFNVLYDEQKKQYRGLLEGMLVTHVFPELVGPHGYLRARVSSVLLHSVAVAARGNLCICIIILNNLVNIFVVDSSSNKIHGCRKFSIIYVID
jgi:hypothetical protein